MSKRLMVLAASSAALFALSAGAALADSSASGSASSGASSVAHSDPTPSGGSTVTIGAAGNENASAGSGAGANASTGGGGNGAAGTFYFIIQSGPRVLAIQPNTINPGGTVVEGSFAAAGAGTHGSVWVQGAPLPSSGPTSGPVAGGSSSSATTYCKVTIKDWSKWWDYTRGARKAVEQCECPTDPKAVTLNQACPPRPNQVYVATVQ